MAVEDVTGGMDMESTASTAEPTATEEHSTALQDTSSVVSGSTLSYQTQTGKHIRFKVLDLESVSRGQNGFSCPYCHDEQLLDTSRSPHEQQKRWGRHVFADLKSYVCLEESCSSQMFENSHTWLRHQLLHHLKEWRCRACNVDQTLNSLQSLKEHYYTQHRLMHKDDDFLHLAQASEVTPKTVSVDRCKFCKWSEFLPKGVDKVSTSRFRKHLGSHLEQIALGMVPEKYRVLDEREDDDGIDDTSNAAFTAACESGDVEAYARLLAVSPGPQDERMAQAFTIAVSSGHLQLAHWLLERGVDVNTLRGSGKCSLYPPSESGDSEMVRILLEAGAEVNLSDASGTAALHLAAQRGHVAVVKTLLEAGAEVDFRSALGTTALHFAAQRGRVAVVRTLLEAGAMINIRDASDITALHMAAQRGHDDVVRTLLRHGADVSAVDATGNTPLSLALSSNHSRVIDLLRDRSEQREAVSDPHSLQSQRVPDDPEEDDEDQRMVDAPQSLNDTEESFSMDTPPSISAERHPKPAAKTKHQNTPPARITKKGPAGLHPTRQRPSEFKEGDMVVTSVRSGGMITAVRFVIEDRKYFEDRREWRYQLRSFSGAVHERGRWYSEDLLKPS
jgi:ankyrin repeat protein